MKTYYQQLSAPAKKEFDAQMYDYTRQMIDRYGAENLDIVEHNLALKLKELVALLEKYEERPVTLTPRLPVYEFKPQVRTVRPVYTAAYHHVVLNGAHPP